jgi:hypothetical protein
MVYDYLWYFDPERTSIHDIGSRHLRQHHDFNCRPGATDVIEKYGLLLDLAQNLSQDSNHNITELCDDSALPHYLFPAYVGLEMAYEVRASFITLLILLVVRTQPCTTTLCNQKGTYDQ